MTSPISTSSYALGNARGLSEVTTSASTALAQNPGLKNIEAQLSRDGARLSGIGKLALALDEFRTSAHKLTGDRLDAAASASGKAVTARLLDAAAATGSHTVEVTQLAQGQQLTSKPLADKSAPLGSGSATLIKVDTGTGPGARSTTVRIEAGNNTLDGIAKAMRNAGLDAKVVQDGKGYALSLTGATGAANTLRVSVAGDAALQGLLSYGPGTQGGLTQQAAARDAQLSVDGKALTSSTNKLDAAIPGVSLTLSDTGKSEVKVARDPSAIAGNVRELVGAFNSLTNKLAGLKTGDAANDAMLGRISAQLGNVLEASSRRALAEVGITRSNGALVLDEAKLNAAIAAEPEKLADLLGKSGDGLAAQFTARVTQQLASGGFVADQAAVVQKQVDKLTAQKTQMAQVLSRQSSMMAQQYAMAGTGGSSLFGLSGDNRPTFLFDIMG